MLITRVCGRLFFIYVLVNFILSLLLLHCILSRTSNHSRMRLKRTTVVKKLLLLTFSGDLVGDCVTNVLLKVKAKAAISHFFVGVVDLPERYRQKAKGGACRLV